MLANRYTWRCVYSDGTHLNQIDSDGTKHAYRDIDRSKLSSFELWEGDSRVLYITFTHNQRLIWRRRVEMKNGSVSEVCHIIGKQETINGKNYQGIIGLFESDGRVEVAGKFEEGHPFFSKPVIHEHEGEEWK